MGTGVGDCSRIFQMLTAGMHFLSGKSLSKHLLSLATDEKEIQWHSVSAIAETTETSIEEVRSVLSAMNRSLLGYEVVVGDGEDKYNFSELETFRIYRY